MSSKDRTQECIEDAFQSLVRHSRFDKITVNMIIEEADVSRATFYRYFKDKYDVMNQIHKERVRKYITFSNNYEDLFYYLLMLSRDNLETLTRLFSTTGVNSFRNYLAEETKRTIEDITVRNRKGKGFTEEEALQVELVCRGISFIAEQWVNGSYNISPREAAHAIYMLLPEQLREYW